MEHVERDPRLSQLSTQWTMIFDAHHGSPEQANEALTSLMLRYSGAVHRYLLKAVGDEKVVEELDQEFALRFLRGQFRHSDPSRGRFRDYVKRAVKNLMVDHFRRREPTRPLDTSIETSIVGESGLEEFDQEFLDSWRKELLKGAWDALSEFERQTGQPYHQLLRFRVANPDLRSPQMAEQLSELWGRPLSAVGVRQALFRARDKFAELLFAEVSASLKSPSLEEIEEELADLKLLEYCRPLLKRKSDTKRKG